MIVQYDAQTPEAYFKYLLHIIWRGGLASEVNAAKEEALRIFKETQR